MNPDGDFHLQICAAMFTNVSSSATQNMSTLEDRSVPAELPTIPSLYDNLCANFRRVLIALNGNPMVVDSVALEKAQEEFTRLTIWGVQSRASVSGIHGSFELEERPEIGNLLIDVLKEADDCLLQILPHASVCDTSSLELMEDSDSDSDSTASSSDGDPHPVSVAMNFKMVFENINELYRLKTLLQKPRLKGRYLHSSRSYQNLPGYQQDYQHVRQKLDCWEMDSGADPDENQVGEGSEPPDQHGISMDELTRRQDAKDDPSSKKDVLCRRLAAANCKRRKQIRYWEAHPYQHDQIGRDDMAKPLRGAQVMKGDVQGHQATTTESVKAPTTVRTFSTAPKSAIFPLSSGRHDLAETQTTYEPSMANLSPHSAARVPDAPSAVDGEGNFECPYCHMSLSTDEISTRIDWKRHVFRDLRPYICTIEDCSDPDRQFVTRYDWMYHESQVHHRQWDCSECDQIFEVRKDFCSHMSSEHQGHWTERQVSLLSQLQERGKDDTAWLSCRLCPASLRKQTYFKHVAAHLEDISLFALPKLVPKDEGEVTSNEVDEKHSINSIGYDIWDTASFTDDIPHQNIGESLPNEDSQLSGGDHLLHPNIASNQDTYDETTYDETTCDESTYDESTYDENTINLNAWLEQPDPNDQRFTPDEIPQLSSGDPLLRPNIASDAQYYIHNEDSTDLASSTAYQYAFPDLSTPPSWQSYEATLGLNFDSTTHPSYSRRLEYTHAGPSAPPGHALYNSIGDASVAWTPNIPLNYMRQSEDRNQYLDPSGPSLPSAPSIGSAQSAQSALSIPFAPPTTNLTSYYPETSRYSRPATERSFEGEERAYTCDFCDARFPTSKDLKRHLPIHNQAPEGEKVDGHYHCRCGMRTHRKENYKRHHKTCVPEKYKHATFICKCSSETNDKDDHLEHIEACPFCKKPRGRPPRSRATSFNEYS